MIDFFLRWFVPQPVYVPAGIQAKMLEFPQEGSDFQGRTFRAGLSGLGFQGWAFRAGLSGPGSGTTIIPDNT